MICNPNQEPITVSPMSRKAFYRIALEAYGPSFLLTWKTKMTGRENEKELGEQSQAAQPILQCWIRRPTDGSALTEGESCHLHEVDLPSFFAACSLRDSFIRSECKLEIQAGGAELSKP
ncbi:hypothetical protein AXG93_2958s1280 [Marchantia polymorpha subsp. ruderalis]|uniref:Uncharacterized protein n=1 Tax=Marchantia polymorpha subsp. ruderalis TaxID=1480154 RepID=A0A176VHA5_MARPO|nr:hypothetical protein AXG93_2958s1280 [Marchantia polymorpha subsp. ruderalis]